ncbi:MAG: AAA family ATPase [Gammaproteobacteria bacterium]|nr:AAA family ATPase [Gammaproteobacteria bacterium]
MPAYCPDRAPPGERALYAALATSRDTSDWIVLHSLAIADHVRQVEGEADFEVIVPQKGVLVIEVKSHKHFEVLEDGRWKLGNSSPSTRSPFQQAKEAMYSVRQYLQRRRIDLQTTPVLSAVWFTQVRARTVLPSTPEWHKWQVLDSEDLRNGVAAAIRRTLAEGTAHLEDKTRNFQAESVGPTETSAERLATILRPRFEMHVVAGDSRRVRESQLITFIEEQYQALDAMADNQAVLFTGPAGSGKTLLAVEAARREVAEGRTGRLLCFNSLLGRRLSEDLKQLPGLSVGTFHQELLRLAGVQPPPNAQADFWRRELPDRVLEALLDGTGAHVREFLIVDEVQDIAREPFLDVLDLLVDGGLSRGRLLLFGDFERQALFETPRGRDALEARCTHLVLHRLTTNCRNLPRIGYVVNTFSRLQPGYQKFRRQDDGVDPTSLTYERGHDQSPQVVESVRSLRDEGFDLDEITVLSVMRSGSTAECTTHPWLLQVLRAADGLPARPGQLQHSTIHAYKGLEAPAVIVTDLDRDRVPNFESLLYVGLTRATDRLVAVIESETLRGAFGGTP